MYGKQLAKEIQNIGILKNAPQKNNLSILCALLLEPRRNGSK